MARKKHKLSPKKTHPWFQKKESFFRRICFWGSMVLVLVALVGWLYYFFSNSRTIPVIQPLVVIRIPLKIKQGNPYKDHAKYLYRYIQGGNSLELLLSPQDGAHDSRPPRGHQSKKAPSILRERGSMIYGPGKKDVLQDRKSPFKMSQSVQNPQGIKKMAETKVWPALSKKEASWSIKNQGSSHKNLVTSGSVVVHSLGSGKASPLKSGACQGKVQLKRGVKSSKAPSSSLCHPELLDEIFKHKQEQKNPRPPSS
jgi:hypothetical protein